jgi:hypothetical protein
MGKPPAEAGKPDTTALVCVECGATSEPDAKGWRVYLDIDGEPVTYCPDCAQRESARAASVPADGPVART